MDKDLQTLAKSIEKLVDAINKSNKIKIITIEKNELDEKITSQMILSNSLNTDKENPE